MTDLLIASVLVGAVSYRVWRIFAVDSITERPRSWFLARTSIPAVRWLMELVLCPYCLGFWVNGAVAAVVTVAYDYTALEFGLIWFAGSTVTGYLGRNDT